MTWRKTYLKMVEDIQRVELENWKKMEGVIAHAISTYDKANHRNSTIRKEVRDDNRRA